MNSKEFLEMDLVVYACNPSTEKAKAEEHEFKASLGYTVSLRPFL
jgi:hypothetical protein